MGKKINHIDKRKSEDLGLEGTGKITHLKVQRRISHKRLFFISKELQLMQRITIGKVVPYISETSGINSSLLLKKKKKKKGKGKGKRKEKKMERKGIAGEGGT